MSMHSLGALAINGCLVRFEVHSHVSEQPTARPHLLTACCECGEMFLARRASTAEANDPEASIAPALKRHRLSGWCKLAQTRRV